ncbi:MAG TPA: PIG-L family deacetylase [Steroidobacteraceae bacterium]
MPFDPNHPGTHERAWLELLEAQPVWWPQARSLVVVSPHPDDEILGAGGLIASYMRSGRRVALVSVTDGEAAFPDWEELARVRRRELDCALGCLGASAVRIERLGLPDGDVQSHRATLRSMLSRVISPSTLLVAPFERDGHPDHEAVGEVCLQVAREHAVALARYPIWAWHHTDPSNLRQAQWGCLSLSHTLRRAKQSAIRAFPSQLNPPAPRHPILPTHVLPYFTRSIEAYLL